MRELRSGHSQSCPKPPISAAIGVFDGVHLGHQAILEAAVSHVRKEGGSAVAVTFDPHPQTVLAPNKPLKLIQNFSERLLSLEHAGVDAVYVVEFNQAFRENPPEAFLDELRTQLGPLQFISVGSEFRFGKNRAGDLEFLRQIGEQEGFAAQGMDLLKWQDQIISSTMIRSMIEAGNVELASNLLGRSYRLVGNINEGDRLGAQLGFPTANLDCAHLVTPPLGVYHCRAFTTDGQKHTAAVNIGIRPTLNQPQPVLRVEAHLLNFSGNLYGQRVELEFVEKIRDEKSFPDIGALKHQIAVDVEIIRQKATKF